MEDGSKEKLKLETAIQYMNADAFELDPALREREVGSFVIDSREVVPGSVFFALSQPEYKDNGFNGDFEDSTMYVKAAFDSGAIACVVRRDRFSEHQEWLDLFRDRLLFADDSIASLQALAHRVYLDWNGPVVAVTGSAGKTTAKELISHVLSASGRKVLKNKKNYNNGLGHPLTVLNLTNDKSYDVAVLEMGMSTPLHEIARLCRITPPDVAVELNVLPVHVEHLGSIENIAAAKAELVQGMKDGGTAVLNKDDLRVAAMASMSKGSVITFGIGEDADVCAKNVDLSTFGMTRFMLTASGHSAEVCFPLNGKHNIYNALAAAAVGITFGMNVGEIAGSLKHVASPPQRGEVLTFSNGITVINDSYNSNPDALLSMVETVIEGGGSGRKIVIAGEMLELGSNELKIHRSVGEKIAMSGVDILIGVRGLASEMVRGALDAGMNSAQFAEDSVAAADLAVGIVKKGDLVLVKGSRGVRTEKVVEKFLERFELEGAGEAVSG